jgi:hypothetical protein
MTRANPCDAGRRLDDWCALVVRGRCFVQDALRSVTKLSENDGSGAQDSMQLGIYLNQLAQGSKPLATGEQWFSQLPNEE